jgi:hypothetical protein
MNKAVAWNATAAAVGIALVHAGVLLVWLALQESVGMTRTAVGSRRLALGATVGVRSHAVRSVPWDQLEEKKTHLQSSSSTLYCQMVRLA